MLALVEHGHSGNRVRVCSARRAFVQAAFEDLAEIPHHEHAAYDHVRVNLHGLKQKQHDKQLKLIYGPRKFLVIKAVGTSARVLILVPGANKLAKERFFEDAEPRSDVWRKSSANLRASA